MRIAVIGGTGQVGREFAKFVPADALQVFGSTDVQVEDRASVDAVFERISADVVVNLAAFHHTDQCEGDPARAFAVNAAGAAHVAAAARDRGLKTCFFSSDYVFGGDAARSVPCDERTPEAPLNIYGASKLAGEQVVLQASAANLVVRTSSLFGTVTSKKGWTFPESMIRKARAGDAMRVVSDQIMAPTYTRDLVERVLALLQRDAAGVCHVANSGTCSWWEFATETLRQSGIDHPIAPVAASAFPTKARRPAYSALASGRSAEFGLEPMRPWTAALAAYLLEKGDSPAPTTEGRA